MKHFKIFFILFCLHAKFTLGQEALGVTNDYGGGKFNDISKLHVAAPRPTDAIDPMITYTPGIPFLIIGFFCVLLEVTIIKRTSSAKERNRLIANRSIYSGVNTTIFLSLMAIVLIGSRNYECETDVFFSEIVLGITYSYIHVSFLLGFRYGKSIKLEEKEEDESSKINKEQMI